MSVTCRTTARAEGCILKVLRPDLGILQKYWINGFGSTHGTTDTLFHMDYEGKYTQEDCEGGYVLSILTMIEKSSSKDPKQKKSPQTP